MCARITFTTQLGMEDDSPIIFLSHTRMTQAVTFAMGGYTQHQRLITRAPALSSHSCPRVLPSLSFFLLFLFLILLLILRRLLCWRGSLRFVLDEEATLGNGVQLFHNPPPRQVRQLLS